VQPLRRVQAQEGAPYAGVERIAVLYGSALASLELREPARAQTALDQALPLARANPATDTRSLLALNLLQAQTWQASGQALRAVAALETQRAPAAGTLSRPLLLARAQAALDAARVGHGETAAVRASTEALQTWVAEQRQDAAAWSLLGQGAELLGLKLRALRAQAEAQAASGDMVGAIDRLRAAQRQARASGAAPDFIEASIIDTRLRELTAQRRAQLAAARGERGDRGGDSPGPERPPGP
jgi:predicted Zn-dependent protease